MVSTFRPESFDAGDRGYDVGAGGVLNLHYTLRGPDPVRFTEVIDFGAGLAGAAPHPKLTGLLALTCSLSYYKAAAPPPRIEIAFPTSEFEKQYLRNLVEGGLGEFAYRNELPGALSPEIIGPDAEGTAAAEDVADAWDPGGHAAGTGRRRQGLGGQYRAFRRHGGEAGPVQRQQV